MSRSEAEIGAGKPLVRPARRDDFAAVGAVIAASALDSPPLLANAAIFGEAAESGTFYVATAAGIVIGVLGAQSIAYDGEKPYTLWIEVVAVHPNWRGRGMGTALYRALGHWAVQRGVQGALTAATDDPAVRALHQRVGFGTHRDNLLLWRFNSDTA